eukprot:TRINITY_DN40_c0_g1_i2.p1 TRINITY_DN40_c0_g1~~TRINITY_DN40_c0_g1_i2.p1  ORF type:complete len:694 (+),score=189.70 TRINITY_DN40_c0_g1_i2:68-2083(+)
MAAPDTVTKIFLKFPSAEPPVVSLLALQCIPQAAKDVKLLPNKSRPTVEGMVSFAGGRTETLSGDISFARFLARQYPESMVYGVGALEEAECNQWIDFVTASTPLKGLSMSTFNRHLRLRTFFAGHSLTLADIYAWISLKRSGLPLLNVPVKFAKAFPNVSRWLNHLDSLPAFIAVAKAHGIGMTAVVAEAKPARAKGRAGWHGSYFDLPGAEKGKVVTRFPPEPSGFLHVGHLKALMLNYHFAKLYEGKMLLRFDDTNPAKEKDEYVDNIIADLKSLNITPSSVSHTSDHFDLILEHADKWVAGGKAYVDNAPSADIATSRREKRATPAREHSLEENVRLWEEMKKGSKEGQGCVVRAKIDAGHKNSAMRDPGIYRCVVDVPHIRTGTKYKVYPLYDFAIAIVDSHEGVTHALRSMEYNQKNELYYWMLEALGVRKVAINDFSRLNFQYTVLSKRKLQKFVDLGRVDGWNDPSFPTVQGLLRRGMTLEALYDFMISQGSSRSNNDMEIGKLWVMNKKIIDPKVPRHTSVIDATKVEVRISGVPDAVEETQIPKHRKNADLGQKTLLSGPSIWIDAEDAAVVKEGEEISLLDRGNIVLNKINTDDSKKITSIEATFNPAGSFKTTKTKLSWLTKTDRLIPATLQTFSNLLTKRSEERRVGKECRSRWSPYH